MRHSALPSALAVLLTVASLSYGVRAEEPDVPATAGETPTPYVAGRDGHADIAAAVRQSRVDHRTVVVVFGGNWCGWCRRLDYSLHHDPVLAPVVEQSFRLVHVDSRSNRALDDELGHPTSLGVPVLVVLDANGRPTFTQETGALELGQGHSRTRVLAFLQRFMPGASR